MAAAAVPSIDSAAAGANVQVREFLKGSPKKLLIGGKWVAARSGKTFEAINPANEEVLGLVAEGDQADVDDAVRVARKAFETGKWPSMGPHQRARYLFKIADLIPLGGYKESGFGRELGRHSIDLYTQIKSVYIKL
jgi:acyl-CoA reductase-like NAD-dependent aldehyde dehydrogenase